MRVTKSLRAAKPVRYVCEMRILILVVATTIVIAGCGSVGTASQTPPTPSAASNPMSFDVTATETTQPRSSDESILAATVNPAATAVRGVTLAAFLAKAPGQVNVSAYGSPTCPSGQACPMYVIVFSLRVTVTP
jgi:hypothetical protein